MSKITKSAKNQDCCIRLPGICNHNPETTVFCHLPGGGMGTKHLDLFGAYGCSRCHDEVDGRTRHLVDRDMVRLYFYEAVQRTQQKLLEQGLVRL